MEKKKGVKKQKNVTFIGVRPINEYAKGIATQFTHKKEKEMIIKARGNNMEKAINVCEQVKEKFSKEKPILIKDVKIEKEKVTTEDGKNKTIQTIEIKLKQK
jgi:DNA-binding protein Alba